MDVCVGYQDMLGRAVSKMIVCKGLVGYVRKVARQSLRVDDVLWEMLGMGIEERQCLKRGGGGGCG